MPNRAFIIGIDNYRPPIGKLNTALNDAAILEQVLKIYHSYTTELYPDITAQDMSRLLEELPSKVNEEDSVLFYFAGHGVTFEDEEGLPQGYLLPADANESDKEKTFISMQLLYDSIQKLDCNHVLLILDCCFAGSFRWASGYRKLQLQPRRIYKELYEQYIDSPAWQVITSSSYNETALDSIDGRMMSRQHGEAEEDNSHSPFAYALFKGLEGQADIIPKEGDGIITASELYLYLREQVTPMSIGIGGNTDEYRQTPCLFPLRKHDRGEYIFFSRDRKSIEKALENRPNRNPYKGLESYEPSDADFFYGRDEAIAGVLHKVEGRPLTLIKAATKLHDEIAEGLKKKSGYPSSNIHILPPSNSPKEALQKMGLPTENYVVSLEKKLKNIVLIITQCQDWEKSQWVALQKYLLRWLTPQVPTFKIVLLANPDFSYEKQLPLLKNYWDKKEDLCVLDGSSEKNSAGILQDLQLRIEGQSFTVVTGLSGSGKSSLVQAGVLPRLKDLEKYKQQLIVSPLKTHTLLQSLQQAQKKNAEAEKLELKEGEPFTKENILKKLEKTILVIDQYEYLTTQFSNDERKAFEEELLRYLQADISGFKVIITIRSDFEVSFKEGVLQDYWTSKHRYLVGALGISDWKTLIRMPAAQYNVEFEEGLLDEIANEVNQQNGALPLLSYAMSNLYEKYIDENNRTFKKAQYEEIGGVAGVLQKQADKVCEDFEETLNRMQRKQQPAATNPSNTVNLSLVFSTKETSFLNNLRKTPKAYSVFAQKCENTLKKVLLRMVAKEGSEYAGRRVFMDELEYSHPEENIRKKIILKELLDKRLVVSGRDEQTQKEFVAPAHDALMRWQRMQEWIEEMKEGMNFGVFQRLREDVHSWEKKQMNPNGQKANLWNREPRLDIVDEERRFAMISKNSKEQNEIRKKKPRNTIQFFVDLSGKEHEAETTDIDTLLNKVEDEFVRESLKRRVKGQRIVVLIAFLIGAVLFGALVFSLESQKYTEAGLAFAEAGNALKSEFNVEKAVEQLDLGFQKANSLWLKCWQEEAIDTFYKEEVGQQTWDALYENGYIRSYNHPNNALINDVFISPDEKYILTASDDKTVIVWQADTNLIEKNIESNFIHNRLNSEHLKVHTIEYPDTVVRVAMSPNGRFIVSGLANGEVYISQVDSNQNLIKISKPNFLIDVGDSVHLVDFSDSTSYFIATAMNRGYLYDVNNFEILDTIEASFDKVRDKIFSNDSTFLLYSNNKLIEYNTSKKDSSKINCPDEILYYQANCLFSESKNLNRLNLNFCSRYKKYKNFPISASRKINYVDTYENGNYCVVSQINGTTDILIMNYIYSQKLYVQSIKSRISRKIIILLNSDKKQINVWKFKNPLTS